MVLKVAITEPGRRSVIRFTSNIFGPEEVLGP